MGLADKLNGKTLDVCSRIKDLKFFEDLVFKKTPMNFSGEIALSIRLEEFYSLQEDERVNDFLNLDPHLFVGSSKKSIYKALSNSLIDGFLELKLDKEGFIIYIHNVDKMYHEYELSHFFWGMTVGRKQL